MIYEEHEYEAVKELREHILSCKKGPKEDMDDRFDEADLAEQDLYSEGSQIKFLQGHILKIKWEAPCSWVGCVWHLYYCKLAENIKFQDIKEVLG